MPLFPVSVLGLKIHRPASDAARVAGMHTFGVTNTVSEEALRSVGAEVVTHSLADWTPDSIH